MANIPAFRIEFIQNNTYGTFVAGDVLTTFIDDTNVSPTAYFIGQTQGVSVELNGSPLALGFTLLDISPSVVTITKYSSFCVGTTLVEPQIWTIYPYTSYVIYEDNYSCAVNPPTCDLIVVGTPTTTPSSSQTTADGSITVTATSTNSIEYNLNSDFVYGNGQSTGVFSGLLPGQYRIFLRDSANCGANVLVDVGFTSGYQPIYRMEYDNLGGTTTRVDITRRGYSGSITEVKGADNPFVLSLNGEGETDKFKAIYGSSANVNLTSVTDSQFETIYTNDRNLYRVEYFRSVPIFSFDLSKAVNHDYSGGTVEWTLGSTPSVLLGGTSVTEYLLLPFVADSGVSYTFSYNINFGANGCNLYFYLLDSSFNQLNIISIPESGTGVVSGDVSITPTNNAVYLGIYNLNGGVSNTCTINSIAASSSGHIFEKLWTGKVLPFIYQEPLKKNPYYTQITAVDGLAELSNAYLIQKDGQKFYGTVSLIKLISYCLSATGLNLNIKVACNIYASGMDSTDSDDPLEQSYIDYECFYLASDQPSLSFVLTSILETFNCRLLQWENKWNIIRVEEVGNDYDYREFNSEGDFIGNSSENILKDVNYPDEGAINWTSFPNIELRPGYGQIKTTYRLGLKPNIFNNGDFRLKSTFVGPPIGYSFAINTDGFTIVNSSYALTQSFEKIDDGNVALVIGGGEDMLSNSNGGNAYIQSASYNVKMGSNNTIKINIRYKVEKASAIFNNTVYQIDVPYVKLRVRVTYGSLYLQSDGSWGSSGNTIDFFVTSFNEFVESEIVALQPTSGTPVSGMSFDVKVYHAYAYWAQFQGLTALRAFATYSGGNQLIPDGYRTELRDDFTLPSYMYFYELEENTDTETGYDIVRPNDYHSTNNPRQWILKKRVNVGTVSGANVFKMAVDRIQGTFLTDGKEPIDAIIRKANAEPLNDQVFEKELIIGSYSPVITTEQNFSISLGVWFPDSAGGITLTTTNVLSSDLIYTGWLRSSSDSGYDLWTRDGINEANKLHAIWLTSYAAQYSRTWRMIRGTVVSKSILFGLINVINDPNDSDKVYIPTSLVINDFANQTSGEFLELLNIVGNSGFDNLGSPFTTGFTSGFGASGFN